MSPIRPGRTLRLLALAATAVIVAALLPFTVSDSGAAAWYLLGMPLVAALCPVIADFSHHAVASTTAGGAVVMLLWALLLGLGIGAWFALPALILGAAATATPSLRHKT